MAKRKKLITIIFVFVSIVLLTMFWAYQYKIVSGHYDKLMISGMEGNTIQVIKDEDEIARIIAKINQSPRSFKYNDGLTYDYLPHGILTFENEMEKVQIAFILSNGKTITKYWEIHTDFSYRQ